MGPIETRSAESGRVTLAASQRARRLRAAEELVKVIARTTAVALSNNSRMVSTDSAATTLRYAGATVTCAPAQRSASGSRSRPSSARISRKRPGWPSGLRAYGSNASASDSATARGGINSAFSPADSTARAVAGPIAAMRACTSAAFNRRDSSRRWNASTAFALVKTIQSYDVKCPSAVSSASNEEGGAISITGTSTGSSPSPRSSFASSDD